MADSINEANGIASAVPGEQKIREAYKQTVDNEVATKDDFTLAPVITVTKKEASFSKGDLKLQKVTVTENISDNDKAEDVNAESMDTIHSEDPKTTDITDAVNIINSETGEEVKKVSKIPRLRFRAAVNKIRREQRSDDNIKKKEMIASVNRRRSSIPRLKRIKTPPPNEETEKKRESINFDDLISNITEADFDKIYEEVVENPNVLDECESTLENKDPTIVERKFDEIIHAYDANKIDSLKIDKSRSKIPLLKRKSEQDIEVKEVRKELQRKGSLGRILISDSFGDKTSSRPKVKIPQLINRGNSLYKQDTKADFSNHITNNDSETGNNNVTHPIVTVTKTPLSQYNKFTNISSIVLNKQQIRVNSTENNNLRQTDEQTCHDGNEDKIADSEFMLPKLEAKSVIQAVISEKSPSPPYLEDSIESKDTTVTKNNLNAGDICETNINNIDDNKTNKINISSESVFYINAVELNEGTNIKPSDIKNTYYNHDFNSISNETPTRDLKSSEPDIEHDKELEINNNDKTIFCKDYLTKEMKIPPKINESEVFIKYKPNVREVDVTIEHSYTNNYNTNTNVDYENKNLNQNESLTSKPVKSKTITASQTVEETNEEDIIILKGKVNRVISRLDSIEPKQKKKPLDDLPKQSVQSKISLFECNDPKPTNFKTIPSKSNLIHLNSDKPRVIEGILKESNKVDDLKESDKRKKSANLENNLPNEKVKIAYGLKDELTRWEKNNAYDSPYSNIIDTEYGLEKNNANEPATNIHSRYNNEEMDKKEDLATEDGVFAKKSAEIINSYKLSQQKKNINIESDMKKAKSLAELDLGDAVTEVKKIIYRMKSVDKIEHRKEIINSRERPRKGSVSERIALFEGRVPKAAPLKMSLHEINSTPAARDNSERIAESAAAAAKYGTFQNMSYVEVGGVDVPALWVGTAMKESGVTKELIKAAIELGYRAFDTAYIYGTEREVGEAIREKVADGTFKREDLFVAGKLWSTFHRTDLVEQVCRESLEKLGLDYFDLYMIHNPMSFKEGGDPIPMIANVLQYSEHDYLDAWFGIEGVVKKGLARAAGVSNFNTKQIQRILDKGKIRPVVNQVESHPYLTQVGLESFCSAHNIRLSVFGTLGSKGTPAPFKSDLSPAIDDPLVITMAAGLGITPAQLLISYQLTLGRAVVVKCSSGARLWENLQAQAAPLRPEHVRALHNLNRNQRTFTFRGMGDTHKNYPFTELL